MRLINIKVLSEGIEKELQIELKEIGEVFDLLEKQTLPRVHALLESWKRVGDLAAIFVGRIINGRVNGLG